MQIDVGRNSAYLRSEAGNLVSEHARSRGLDRIVPIVVVVAQSVREIQDCHLADV